MAEPDYEEFSSYRNFLSCSNVNDLEYEDRCDYVRSTPECMDKGYFFNYIKILYCSLGPTTDAQQNCFLILLMSMCVIMFVILGTTADKFFCPALEVMSKIMGMSEHLAGVTLLAFGNGSPDLFTNLASAKESSSTLFSNMLGSSIYVTAFIGGVICLIRSFRVDGSNILRDTSFFIFGILSIDFIMKDGYVTTWESVCLILIYVVYLITILVDQYLLKRQVLSMEALAQSGNLSAEAYKRYSKLHQEANIDIVHRLSHTSVDIEGTRHSFEYVAQSDPNENLWQQLRDSLKPFEMDEWHSSTGCQKTMLCLKTPILCTLQLFLPIVNYESERHGWSKLLNCLQVVMSPIVMFLLICGLNCWKYCLYSLGITIPLSIVCFMYTRTDEPPKFHAVFAILTALGSMCTIYSCAAETVEILYVLGLILDCSNSFLGCTLLAWGNGVGDLISDATLAFHGYPRMAFAASIGGPFFNTLLGIGCVMLLKNLYGNTGYEPLPSGPLGENCFVFLLLVLFSTLLWSVTTNFHIRRCIGVFSVCLYGLFFLYTVLGECEVIQTYAEISQYGTE
ncbi:mitochondrial sodium/calcium exchanger protein [Musca domestica]|uniref:Mitochondrial sodium/calcium exchanger protein n=1 Tax=Musca domestica TaxID=7370 RepID=A0A9J7DKK4_MUSDO|nr:mitochondrial sodium/calcium exchanger protein [Musca domestica]